MDQKYQLTIDELKTKFTEWLTTREKSWIEYYPADRAIRFFITDASGLHSVFEEKEYSWFYDALRDIYIAAH